MPALPAAWQHIVMRRAIGRGRWPLNLTLLAPVVPCDGGKVCGSSGKGDMENDGDMETGIAATGLPDA